MEAFDVLQFGSFLPGPKSHFDHSLPQKCGATNPASLAYNIPDLYFRLLDLTPEVFSIVISFLDIHDLRNLSEADKSVQLLVEPALYNKIYTKRGTHNDTRWVVLLLRRRPEVRSWIRFLVLDELDEEAFRDVLAFELPNLRSILLQHRGQVTKTISAERKRELNALVIPKPRLKTFTIIVMLDPFESQHANRTLFPVTVEDAIFWRQPSLRRIRISYLDLTALSHSETDPFSFENLETLEVEVAKYDSASLTKLFHRAQSLQTIYFSHWNALCVTPEDFVPLLHSCKATLKVLKLPWRRPADRDYSNTTGIYLNDFTALKQLVIDPKFLLGPYNSLTRFARHIEERMPPNLKILQLDSILPPRSMPLGYLMAMPDADYAFLRTIIEKKKSLLPHLRLLFYTDSTCLAEPDDLFSLAEEHKIQLEPLKWSDNVNVDVDWLDTPSLVGEEAPIESSGDND